MEAKAQDVGIKSDKMLRKELSKTELLFLSLQGIIGSGWLFASLYTAAYTGSAGIISWIIGGILLIFIALTYSEISSAIPKSGGVVRYPHYTHGGIVGYIIAWSYFAAGATVPAIESTAIVTYLSSLIPSLTVNGYLTPTGLALAYGFLFLFFMINYFGVKSVGKVAHIVGWWKLIIPIATIILLFLFDFHPSNFTANGFFPSSQYISSGYSGWASVLYAIPITGILFSYTGFRQAIEYGGEAKNPSRDIPFAVIGALSISIVIYTLLQVAFIGGINWSAIGVKFGNWTGLQYSSLSSGPFYEIFKNANASSPINLILLDFAILLLIDSAVSPAGTTITGMGTGTRVLYGLASNGYFPEIFLKIGKTRIPVISLITVTLLGGVFLLPFPAWIALVGIVSSAAVFTYIMGGIGLQVLRTHAPELNRPYKLPFAKVLSPISTLVALLIVYWSGFITLFEVVTIIFAGLPILFGYYSRKSWNISRSLSALLGVINALVIGLSDFFFYIKTNGLAEGNTVAFVVYLIVMTIMIGLDMFIVYKKSPNSRQEIKAGAWLPALIFSVLALSYFGSFGLDVIIPFPEDLIALSIVGLVFHYIAVRSGIRTKAIEEIIESTKGLI
ncbi:amino acid permease [Acidianus sulfidivorans JP7]|uniref:Amino acid permease n=1 Tax=Acidianus sulfidivorans JP7 TaxID=619593 RepID=A0A2U9ILF1_9CREN|nr:APC family permease [Acidianus sulfidivorans]AWR96852.1 amino acid permease [Acidianus sulfidivorans JP7]